MSHLAFLVATHDALSDKSGLYAKSLSAQIKDRELKLRSVIRRMLFTPDHYEGWVAGRLNIELYNLEMTPISALEALNVEVCRRIEVARESAGFANGRRHANEGRG
jgi:hypothetical protein